MKIDKKYSGVVIAEDKGQIEVTLYDLDSKGSYKSSLTHLSQMQDSEMGPDKLFCHWNDTPSGMEALIENAKEFENE